jgi:hemerythrin-like domain-containing protein
MGCHATAASPTDVLRAEHRIIERALDVLDHLAQEGQRQNRLDVAAGRQLVEFLRTFADDCHHGKEESILFPALERVVPGFGPAVVMRHEHEEGRAAVGGLALALEQADPLAFARHAYAYVSLLRGHIQKEDHCLWPMADSLLTESARAEVLAAFERAEVEHMGLGVHERMLAKLDDLLRACGLPSRAPDLLARTGRGCGCSHAAAPRA